MSDEHEGRDPRLEALEEAVRRLSSDVSRLQSEVGRLKGMPASAASAAGGAEPVTSPVVPLPLRKPAEAGADAGAQKAPPGVGPGVFVPSPPLPPRQSAKLPPRATVAGGVVSGGVEQAIGRYGTLVVATLAILLGVGAFLQWAIARGMLTPEIRVALGAVVAVVLAALGMRLRTKGSRTFGNALLVIALAVVHLVAWGAGPVLGIVPPLLALAVAAVASVVLAGLALREGEEFLFILGLGGALLAPFVTMTGEGGPRQLLLFGGLLLAAAIVALRDATWRLAPRLLSPFALGYMASAAGMRRYEHGLGALYWPTAFALVLALVALVAGARGTRRGLVKGMLFLVAVGIMFAGGHRDALPWTGIVYAFLGTLTMHALRRRTRATEDGGPDTWVEVVGIPLLFLFTALVVEDAWKAVEGAPISAVWIALTGAVLYVDPPALRARHLTVMLVGLLAATASLYHGDAFGIVFAFAVVAALSVFTLQRVPGASLLLPIGMALGFGTLRAQMLIDRRDAWEYTPFLNHTALAGLTIVASWLFLSYTAKKAFSHFDLERKSWEPNSAAELLALLGPIVAFFWIRSELLEAYSRDIATFLLITYYALAGVGTILVGRKREIDALRQAGLALTLFAAGKAFLAANGLSSIGLRVGSYLIVGVFVLGVGYLYRAGPAEEARPE